MRAFRIHSICDHVDLGYVDIAVGGFVLVLRGALRLGAIASEVIHTGGTLRMQAQVAFEKRDTQGASNEDLAVRFA